MNHSTLNQNQSQAPSPLEYEYFTQFSSWDAVDSFADDTRDWLISCGINPIRMETDGDTTCSAHMTQQDYIDLSEQPSDNSVFVIVDHDYIDIMAGIVEVFIWHKDEVIAFHSMNGGQS